jgi:4-carboxymuconolactone decarboxylase
MKLQDPSERVARGLATQAHTSGRDAPPPATLLEESWRDFIYAEVWTRPGLDLRSRYLIAMASAASSNGPTEQLVDYARGALRNGALTLGELREAALHLAVYAGWSRGGELDRAVSRAADELGLAPVQLAPIRAEPWDPADRIAQGIAQFDKVMGFPGPAPVTPYLGDGINNFVFAEMWKRPGLDQRSRRWITLVGVSDSGAPTPIQTHFYAAMSSGNCSSDELQEFVLHYAVHAGWPKASVIQGAVNEMARKFAAGIAWNG